MPDITMCQAGLRDCPIRDKCYRHTAKPSWHQSWFTEAPFKQTKEGSKCAYFWDNDQSLLFDIKEKEG